MSILPKQQRIQVKYFLITGTGRTGKPTIRQKLSQKLTLLTKRLAVLL
jgi:hypothetical protein